MTDLLLERGAAIRVNDAESLAKQVQTLFADQPRRQQMGAAAISSVAGARGAVERTVLEIDRVLQRQAPLGSASAAV